jgi:hypothetical protein
MFILSLLRSKWLWLTAIVALIGWAFVSSTTTFVSPKTHEHMEEDEATPASSDTRKSPKPVSHESYTLRTKILDAIESVLGETGIKARKNEIPKLVDRAHDAIVESAGGAEEADMLNASKLREQVAKVLDGFETVEEKPTPPPPEAKAEPAPQASSATNKDAAMLRDLDSAIGALSTLRRRMSEGEATLASKPSLMQEAAKRVEGAAKSVANVAKSYSLPAPVAQEGFLTDAGASELPGLEKHRMMGVSSIEWQTTLL